jgi:hypothetical protein
VKTTGKQRGGITGKGFLPEESGNPNGRPRTARFSDAVRRLAAEVGSNGETGAEQLAKHCFRQALRGSVRHAELFLNYAEGKPKQPHEISGPAPTELSIEEVDARILESIGECLKDPASRLGHGIRNW